MTPRTLGAGILGERAGEWLFVADVDAAGVVAFASRGPGRSRDPVDPAYQGELWGMHILEEYRRRGLGRALAREVVRAGLLKRARTPCSSGPAGRPCAPVL